MNELEYDNCSNRFAHAVSGALDTMYATAEKTGDGRGLIIRIGGRGMAALSIQRNFEQLFRHALVEPNDANDQIAKLTRERDDAYAELHEYRGKIAELETRDQAATVQIEVLQKKLAERIESDDKHIRELTGIRDGLLEANRALLAEKIRLEAAVQSWMTAEHRMTRQYNDLKFQVKAALAQMATNLQESVK